MSRLDDHLTRGLERAARLADPSGVFERIDRRRARRHALQRVQAVSLAVIVIAGSVGGFVFLSKAFGPARAPGGEAPIRNGLLVVSMYDKWGEHLYIVDPSTPQADSKGPINLTLGHPEFDTDPAVSPDGTTLAFARKSYIDNSVTQSIWSIGIDGSGLHQIASAPASSPAWSPDGTQLAFAGSPGGPYGIWIVNADGSAPHLVAGTGDLSVDAPSWSPDGTRIVFQGSTEDTNNQPTHWDLYVSPVVASSSRLSDITNTPGTSEVWPAWSPDGSTIVFVRANPDLPVDETPNDGLATIRPDGTDQRQLTAVGSFDQHPSWSPDSSVIVFDRLDAPLDSSRLTDTSIYTIRPDGSGLDRISVGIDPSWQPIPPGSTTPAPTASPTQSGPVDIGLGFPVCDVRSMSADFDGNGTPDTASVATKMSDVGCPAPGTSTEVMVVDLNGDGKADAVGGPLACPTGCDPFATPDVDGDELPEIAIVADRSDDGTKRIQLWDVTTPPGGSLAVIPFVDANGDPVTFTWGTVVNWGGVGPEVFGVSCTSRTSPPLVTEWQAIPTDHGSWHISEHGYHVVGAELRSAFEDSYDVPGEETAFPDGGGDTMCGSPVHIAD